MASEGGCRIGELKDFNLQGELCICKLENIAIVRDVEEANLSRKQHIDVLMLHWGDGTVLIHRRVEMARNGSKDSTTIPGLNILGWRTAVALDFQIG